jgi:ribokinase
MASSMLVVGSLILDMVVRSSKIPVPGENICGASFAMVAGGKGANQAVASHRLGNMVSLLGRVGDDYFGEMLISEVESAGVDASLVRRTRSHSTGVALIVVEECSGLNTIVVDPGANMALEPDDLDILAKFPVPDVALFQLEAPIGFVIEAARRCSSMGARTVLDAGPPRGATPEVLEGFDVVSPNRFELADITGMPVATLEEAAAAAVHLVDAGVGTVVVKMGPEGALAATADGCWHFPTFDIEPVDATAAGDAFTAALATAMCEGMSLEQSVAFANAAGALAVTRAGALPSMPSRAEVVKLFSSREVSCSAL